MEILSFGDLYMMITRTRQKNQIYNKFTNNTQSQLALDTNNS